LALSAFLKESWALYQEPEEPVNKILIKPVETVRAKSPSWRILGQARIHMEKAMDGTRQTPVPVDGPEFFAPCHSHSSF
jgi:hypothetical protein